MPTPKALHSKKTPKWGTPEKTIEIGRKLLDGRIDLDPASSEEFNAYVRAMMIYTERDNGLAPECEWAGNVFCNPPGGLVNEFWRKLCEGIKSGAIPKAFWVGFSVEQLCTLAGEEFHPLDFSFCVLRKRLAFNQQVDTPILGPWDPNANLPTVTIEVRNNVGNLVQELRNIVGYEPPKIIRGDSPAHGNYVCGLGVDRALFDTLLSDHGKISHGRLST